MTLERTITFLCPQRLFFNAQRILATISFTWLISFSFALAILISDIPVKAYKTLYACAISRYFFALLCFSK